MKNPFLKLIKTRATFIMKSGANIVVYCNDIKITFSGSELRSYNINGIRGENPFYIRIEDVSAITTKQMFIWCR
jgi:hypothetical protein